MRLLANFQPREEWLLDPGDILYIPPRVAHNGVAVGEPCMTYSIGFRAPSRAELIAGWCDDLVTQLSDDDRYGDPGLARQDNPGEITGQALAALHALVTDRLGDREAFARWFGGYSTTRKYPEVDWAPDEPITAAELRGHLARGVPLLRNPASRFSFIRGQARACALYVDGEHFACTGPSAAFAELICAQDRIALEAELAADDAVVDLIAKLINQGSVAIDDLE